MQHSDLIPQSSCDGRVFAVGVGLYEDVGWTVHDCESCDKEIHEYPASSGIKNQEKPKQKRPILLGLTRPR